MNYISTIIIFTITYLVYYGAFHLDDGYHRTDTLLEQERLEHLCRYYKLQENRNEK